MSQDLSYVSKMVYPGRLIIIGKSPDGSDVVMYAITGRSPSSQARKLELDDSQKAILVKPTDEETLKTGQVDLLIYSAVMFNEGTIVGNGKQTDGVKESYNYEKCPVESLVQGQQTWDYEPDGPNFTPRISGCITCKGAALSIIKHAEDDTNIKNYFYIPRIAGKGYMISTYTGVNENPLPSFSGEPVEVGIPWNSADECATAFYEALAPENGQPDFRVTAAIVYKSAEGAILHKIINRHGN